MATPTTKPQTQEEITEARLQNLCLMWLNRYYREQERWFHSIPNGEKRDPITAARLKATGVKSGVADTFLPEPRGIYHGLYIELKTLTGRLSEKQREFIAAMRQRGYCVVVLDTLEAFQALISEYLPLKAGELLPEHHFARYPL
jgi:hypothetical protein